MSRALPLLLLLVAALAWADNDSEMEALFKKHLGAFEQLSRHHMKGEASDDLPLPKQKNTGAPVATGKGMSSAGVADSKPADETFTFKANNVWASLTIHVTDKHGSFRIVGECDEKASGWAIKNKAKVQIAKGSLNDQKAFAFEVNEPFTKDLELTVYVTKDNFMNPAYVPLY